MRNKHLCLVLTLCALLCVSLLALGTAALEADESGVVHLRTADDVLQLMNNATLWDKDIVLENDIDLSTYSGKLSQQPIGNQLPDSNKAFTGTLIGKLKENNTNPEISGLNIVTTAVTNRWALIGWANNGTETDPVVVKNITVRGTVSTAGGSAAGLVGYVENGYATIENCVNYCSVTATHQTYSRAGGILGVSTNSDVTVTNCKNYGKVSGYTNIAGIVGRLEVSSGTHTYTVTNCYNEGEIEGLKANSGFAGIVGSPVLSGGTGTINIEGCYNKGYIHGPGYIAGIAGAPVSQSDSGTLNITDCWNAGKIESTTDYAGGAVGYDVYTKGKINYGETILRFYNAGEVVGASGKTNVAGVIGVARKTTATYAYYSNGGAGGSLSLKDQTTAVTPASTVEENKALFPGLTGADAAAWVITKTGPELAAFHTHTPPNADGQCDTCGYQLVGACAHANKKLQTITAATCVATGTEQYYCPDCKEWVGDVQTIAIDLTNHTGTDYAWRQNDAGKYEFACTACGTVIKTQDEQPVVYLDNLGGDDANVGLTATTEVKTLAEAVKRLAEVGGTVYFTGRYNFTEHVTLPAYAKPITFTGTTDASGNANAGFVIQTKDAVLTLGGETIFDTFIFKGEGATNMIVAANWNDVTFGYVRINKDATIGLYAGNYLTTEDDTEAKTSTINLKAAVIAGDSTAGHVFYKNVALGSWFGTDGQTVSNKTVALNVNDGTLPNGTAVSATVGTLYTMSSTNDAAKRHTNTPNCTSVVNLNGDTVVTTLRTGDRNVNGSSTVTDATGYLDSLTLNFNDNSTLGATAVLRNVKNATLKISTEAEGRTTAITKGVQLQAFGDFASEGTVGQVNAAYGEHSFAASLANPIAALAGHEANYQINADVTPEHVWGEGEVTTAPGVGTVGEKTYTCTCGLTKTEEIPALKAALTQKSISAATNTTSGESTMRFIAALEVANGVTVKKIGTYISLVAIGEDGKPSTEGAKVAVKEQAVTDAAPATFAVDLTGIPADQAGTSVFAWAYAVLSDGTRVTVAFDAATVNALVSVQ